MSIPSFCRGAARFSRARGSSLFARQFNGELPKRFGCSPVFSQSFGSLGERPISGFAEQFRDVSFGVELALSSGDENVDDDAVCGEEDGALISSQDLWFSVKQWNANESVIDLLKM